MTSVFISYRRTDTPGHAGRLYDRFAVGFGESNVFKDLDSLEPGADFVDVIEGTIARCDALVAVIGPGWVSAKRGRSRRLDDPQDWVRLEIATALKRGIRVVPVLVQGASMPSAADLPDELRDLARRHPLQLGEDTWALQVDRLIAALSDAPDTASYPRSDDWTRPPTRDAGKATSSALQETQTHHDKSLPAGASSERVAQIAGALQRYWKASGLYRLYVTDVATRSGISVSKSSTGDITVSISGKRELAPGLEAELERRGFASGTKTIDRATRDLVSLVTLAELLDWVIITTLGATEDYVVDTTIVDMTH